MGLTAHVGRAGAVAVVAMLAGLPAFGQGPPARPQPAPAAAAKAPPPQATGDAALRQRVEQLEEQLVDMQVVIGTLESLGKGGAAPSGAGPRGNPGAAAAMNASDAGRLDAMETQIRALAAQLEQLQEQMRSNAGRSGALPPNSTQAGNDVPVGPGPSPRPGRPQAEANPNAAERTGFGSVTVSPDSEGDQIGKMINAGPGQPGPQVASAPADGDVGSKQVYETAYGHLLQRDYGAAEAAFEEFLRRYPSDPLAGNAQYWLGESLYVRGQYRAAAGAFLKGYQTYSRSAKAPESLLKLAMSLQRLGQKDAACSSYSELTTKFPNAPPHVKTSAQAERQRAGC